MWVFRDRNIVLKKGKTLLQSGTASSTFFSKCMRKIIFQIGAVISNWDVINMSKNTFSSEESTLTSLSVIHSFSLLSSFFLGLTLKPSSSRDFFSEIFSRERWIISSKTILQRWKLINIFRHVFIRKTSFHSFNSLIKRSLLITALLKRETYQVFCNCYKKWL